jgi:hypothetical protein
MDAFYTNQLNAVMPPQKLPMSKKDKAWREACVDAVAGMSNTRHLNGKTSWERKQINYDLINSIQRTDDMTYVLDPYGLGKDQIGGAPAQMRDMNIIVNKINLLKGEEMSRPFNFHVMAVNGEAVTFKEDQLKKMLLEAAQKILAKESGIPDMAQTNPETGEIEEPPPFEQIQKFANTSVKDVREQYGSHILEYIKHSENLKLKFNEGWEHSLIVAEEIYYVGIYNGEVKIRVCNPLNCEYDRNPDNPTIEDGDWFKEDRWMTAGQILDQYNDKLSEKQIAILDKGDFRQSASNQMYPGFAYTDDSLDFHSRGNSATNKNNSNQYLVTEVCWKSMKRVGFVSYPDETGEMQEGIVDGTFKLTPEMKEIGYVLEWRWISEIWTGTKIGDDFYVDINPMPNQSRSMDNPGEVKLPYIGRVYNSTNSVQTSLVDLLKPHQYLYNIVWYRLEAEIAKAKGKKMVMDMAQIPKSEGIDLDKWMYFFDNVGIAFINSFEEGKDKFQGQVSQFNQFQALDMTLSQSVAQYIGILNKIEQLVDKIIGITPQREGSTSANETATGTRAAINNSVNITEPWFYMHNEVKKRVLTAIIETSKFAYPDKKKLNYMLNDVERIFMEIDMEKFADSDYGVFVTDSSEDNAIFQKLEQLSEMLIGANAASFSDIISMFKSTSISELGNNIKESERKKQEQEQQAAQQQQEMQQQQIEAQRLETEAARMFEAEQNYLDRQNKLQVEALKTMGYDTDTADNDQIDVIGQAKIMLEQTKVTNDIAMKQYEIKSNSSDKEKDRSLKREEIKSKERIEKLKAETALKNKVAGEK